MLSQLSPRLIVLNAILIGQVSLLLTTYAKGQSLSDQYDNQQYTNTSQLNLCKQHLSKFNYALPDLAWGYGFRADHETVHGKSVSLTGSGLAIYRIDDTSNIYATTSDPGSCPQIEEYRIGQLGELRKWNDGYEQQFLMEDGKLCQYSKTAGKITKSCLVKQLIYPFQGKGTSSSKLFPFRTDDLGADFEKFSSAWLKARLPKFEDVSVKHLDKCSHTSHPSDGYSCNFGNLELKWRAPATGSISCVLSQISWSKNDGITYKGECENIHFYPLKVPQNILLLLKNKSAEEWKSWVESENWLMFRTDRAYSGQKAKIIGSNTCSVKQFLPMNDKISRGIKCTGTYQVPDGICSNATWGMLIDESRGLASITITSRTKDCKQYKGKN
jgi:hypothetical protein